jgi:hypothetical protein
MRAVDWYVNSKACSILCTFCMYVVDDMILLTSVFLASAA